MARIQELIKRCQKEVGVSSCDNCGCSSVSTECLKYLRNMSLDDIEFDCSVCGESLYTEDGINVATKFCPECGRSFEV